MRSDHAKFSNTTEVTFDFMLGQEVFRVTRTLKSEQSEEMGAVSAYKTDKAILWQRTGLKADEVGTVLASKWKKVTEKVEYLLGFECTQFRQVILLPQDQFQKLLMASSQTREDLFRTLFQTEQFELIEKTLRDEAKHLTDELRALVDKRQWTLEIAQVASTDELTKKFKEIKKEYISKRSLLESLRTSERQASERLAQGQKDQTKINERNEAETQLSKIEASEKEFEEKKTQLSRAQKAAELVDLEDSLIQHQVDVKKFERNNIASQTGFEQAQKAQNQALIELDTELKHKDRRDAAHKEHERLIALERQVQDLEAARNTLNTAQQRLSIASSKRENSQTKRDRIQKDLAQFELELTQAETVSDNLQFVKKAEIDAKQVHDNWYRLVEITDQWRIAQKVDASTLESVKKAEKMLMRAREKRDELEDAWHMGQASLIASQLVENAPCPVCGSIHHPQPAKSDRLPPSETELKKARSDLVGLEAQKQKSQDDWSKSRENTVRLDADRKPLLEFLGDKANLSQGEIDKELSDVSSNRKRVEEDYERLSDIKKRLEPQRKLFEGAEGEFSVAEHSWQEASNEYIKTKAIFSERERAVPLELNDARKLKSAQEAVDKLVTQLDLAFHQAQQNDVHAKQNLAAAEATLKESSDQMNSIRQRTEEISQQFSDRVFAAGFQDPEDYRSSKMQNLDRIALDKKIREYEGQLRAAKERVGRANKAAESLKKPDIEKLEADFQASRNKVDSTFAVVEDFKTQKTNLEQYMNQLSQVQKEFERNEKMYTVIGKIADVANGKNAYNLTFQRFVLSALLDDVLSDATQRLKIMSRGRYILQRAQTLMDKRKASGLNLVINDTWTGDSKRPVETLSGGEGFYTSLALALGLAEVVQHYSGGMRLDTIFIDEGFGSLDADTLDLAIKTLESLKENGRLVGIISHVESLRERIPIRIEVTSSVKGSSVKVVNA